jgi:aminocarboxymuconate-semialdehyde decarboxylase
MPAETSLAICSMIFGGVFQKFPKLRVAFAHGGGSFPITLGRIQHGFEVRPDLCAIDCDIAPKDFIGKFFVDSLVHDKNSLEFLVHTMGAENICFGTDYPFPLGELKPGKLITECNFDLKTQESLFHKSALKWLGMKAEDFTGV